tara:strand:+ start:162 stop:770 length:609 start_codon:yes stop_codon:yes gene_type:complete
MAGYNNMQRGPAPPLYGGGQRGGFGQAPRGVPGRMPSPTPSAMRGRGIGIGQGIPQHRPIQGAPGQEFNPGMMSGPESLNRRFNPGMMNRPEVLNRMGPHGMSGEAQTRQPFQDLLDWLNDNPYGDMMRSGNPQAPYDQPKGGGPGGGGQPPMQPGGMGRPSRPLYSQPVSGGTPYEFGQFAGGGGQSPLYQPQMPQMPRGY